ncbi:hypothetical protein DOTSEDRAFT_29528 [Dothistroma septosporum NZE10]|uniref:Amidohydrolase-related domain-containing protein n=1 Tax=Dothistroma septosporum (strain NZE10 / CBS 128990) TaxID=675120 RepID=N1PDG6_DOTSN|nr:hypothetical protein DOTSEDRAFT_29528 [Dothistroma septosporum NZE10]
MDTARAGNVKSPETEHPEASNGSNSRALLRKLEARKTSILAFHGIIAKTVSPDTAFLIKDVLIFDGETIIENGSVLVKYGKISQVFSSPISFTRTIISKPGHTLLPGLIDVHIHADGGTPVALPQALHFGVMTVCDMHNEWPNIQKLRNQREAGDCADL